MSVLTSVPLIMLLLMMEEDLHCRGANTVLTHVSTACVAMPLDTVPCNLGISCPEARFKCSSLCKQVSQAHRNSSAGHPAKHPAIRPHDNALMLECS
jgi:hypothetical protein